MYYNQCTMLLMLENTCTCTEIDRCAHNCYVIFISQYLISGVGINGHLCPEVTKLGTGGMIVYDTFYNIYISIDL